MRRMMVVAASTLVVSCSEEAGLSRVDGQPPDAGAVVADATLVGGRDAEAVGDGAVILDAGTRDAAGTEDGGQPDAGDPPRDRTDVTTLPLGPILLDADGRSGPVGFDLPGGVVSFSLSDFGPLEGTYIVRTMTGPTGVLVTDDDSGLSPLERLLFGSFGAQFFSPNRVVPDRGASAAVFPNNPSVSVTGGRYTFELQGLVLEGQQQGRPYSGFVDVVIHYRTVAAVSGRLDLTLYLTGAGGFNAVSAPGDRRLQDALDEVSRIYSQFGVQVGTVQYIDVDPSFRTISGAVDGSSTELEQMFALTAGRGPGLNFFMVDRFEGGFGGMVAGIAGGLPGSPLSPGAANAGVAVAVAGIGDDAQVLGHVMAHEGGHWLGLFHTEEFVGTVDQIPDTPGESSSAFLMFPAVGGGTRISTQQGNVARNHVEVIAE